MNDKKILKIIDKYGKEIQCRILIIFKWSKTNKNYVVYTDDTTDENGKLNVYAATYCFENLDILFPIEYDVEWDEIDRRLKKILLGCGS